MKTLVCIIGYLVTGCILFGLEILAYAENAKRRNLDDYMLNKREGTVLEYLKITDIKIIAGILFWPLATLSFIIYFCWKPFLEILLYIPETIIITIKLLFKGISDTLKLYIRKMQRR